MRYELTLNARIKPASRKNVITSSAGTTPTNTYDRISLRRTRHSRRRFAQTAGRVGPYAPANSSARLPTMSIASSADGSVVTALSGYVIALMITPSMSARPGKVRSNQFRTPRQRDGMSPGSSATGRTGSLIGRLPEYPFHWPYETQRRRALQHDLHSRRSGTGSG